jgi:parallel beta-helix repeat protein
MALVALYHATNGPDWDNNTRWLSDTRPVDHWYGVYVDTPRVDRLILDYNLLSGELPEEIGALNYLETLRLNWNQIGGAIPAGIGNLVRMEDLRIYHNNFTHLPGEIGNLILLTKLDLSNNKFDSIPSGVGNLINLKYLWAEGNELTYIPKTIGMLSNLLQLYLKDNGIEELPEETANLSKLEKFYLDDNKLDSLPSFELMTKLISLTCSRNNIQALPASIGSCVELEFLDISDNLLSSLPLSLLNLNSIKQLYVDRNQLNFRDLERYVQLPSIYFSYTQQEKIKLEEKMENGSVKYIFNAGGDSTTYEWYLDHQLVSSTNDSFYIPDPISVGAQQLHCIARNSLLPNLIFRSDTLNPKLTNVINSSGDLGLDTDADDVCTTGEMIEVNGEMVPECTLRAAIELVNKTSQEERTDFIFQLTNGLEIKPAEAYPKINYPIGLDASAQTNGQVSINGELVPNPSSDRSICFDYDHELGINLKDLAISNFGYGVYAYTSNEGQIEGNSFSNIRFALVLSKCSDYEIVNNELDEVYIGLAVREGNRQIISENSILSEKIAIEIIESDSNQISSNSLKSSLPLESNLKAGIRIEDGSRNQIEQNSISGNTVGCLLTCRTKEMIGNKLINNQLFNNNVGIWAASDHQDDYEILFLQINGNVIGRDDLGIPGSIDVIAVKIDSCNETRILNNTIVYQKLNGVDLLNDKNSVIRNNTIGSESTVVEGVESNGIYGIGSEQLRILRNVVSGNKDNGIQLIRSSGSISENFIGTNRNRNKLIPNKNSGIYLENSKLEIDENWIYGNGKHGIYSRHGRLKIKNNTIGKSGSVNFGNNMDGINLFNTTATIEDNYIESNDRGIYGEELTYWYSYRRKMEIYSNRIENNREGVSILDSEVQILNNSVSYNYDSGIKIEGKIASDPAIINNNIIKGNGGNTGIHLINADAIIDNNFVSEDASDGIFARGFSSVYISRNNIEQNGAFAVNNMENQVLADAENNWWGHSSGPSGAGPGQGDEISINVKYDNWSQESIGMCISTNSDTLLVHSGQQDSVKLFYQNWSEMDGLIDVHIHDDLNWIDPGVTDHTILLEEGIGASENLLLNVPILIDNTLVNEVMVIASSVVDAENRDTLVFYLTNASPTLSAMLLSPDTLMLKTGDTANVYLEAYTQFDESVVVNPEWIVTGGRMLSNNKYVADTVEGTYDIIVYEAVSGMADTSIVIINDFISDASDPYKVVSNKPEIKIFPNPAYNEISIDIRVMRSENILLNLYSQEGRLIKKWHFPLVSPGNDIELYLHAKQGNLQLQSGLYFLHMQTDNCVITKRIILL